MDDEEQLGMPSKAVHAGEMHDPSGAHIDPIHMTSTYVFEDSEAIRAWGAGRLTPEYIPGWTPQ